MFLFQSYVLYFDTYILDIEYIAGGDTMPKKDTKNDIKIIYKYADNVDENKDKTFHNVMQKLFNSYIIKAIQNINKGE